MSEAEFEFLLSDLAAKALPDQELKIGLVVNGEDLGRVRHAAPSAQRRLQFAQPLPQVVKIDRLRYKIGCASLESAFAPLFIAVGSQHHDWDVRPARLDLAQEREPIHPR